MNILITSAGRRVSLVRFFMKHVKEKVPLAKVYTTDCDSSLSSACQVADQCFCVSKIKSQGYISELLAICVKYNIKILVPTIDTELLLLSQHRNSFLQIGTHCIVSDPNVVSLFRDKYLTSETFKKIGITPIGEYSADSMHYPVYVKPILGSSSKDNYIAYSKKELSAYSTHENDYIFQEYIDNEKFEEYTVDMYFDRNSNLKCMVPRLRMDVRSGEVSKTKTVRDEAIMKAAIKLAKLRGIRGCINVQFFKEIEGERLIGIEVNARFGGGYPLLEYCDASYINYIIDEYLFDKDVSYNDSWIEEKIMLRYDAEVII